MPSGSTLLDDFLAQTSPTGAHALSDDDLLKQLQRTSQSTGNGPSSGFADAFNTGGKQEEESDDRGVATSIKAASHGVKVLAPLLSAVSRWTEEGDNAQIEKIMTKALERLRSDARQVAIAFGVNAEEAPIWLTSQVSGMLMPVMISALDRNNGAMLDETESSYLEPLLALAQSTKSDDFQAPSFSNNPKWQIIEALTMATTEVMTEYAKFNYFHADAAGIAQMVSDYLSDRIITGTMDDITQRWNLNEDERCYLSMSLIKSGGKMLASCWAEGLDGVFNGVKELPKQQQREVLVTGYPLDHLFDQFERLYQGVELSAISALRALEPMRENAHLAQTTNNARPR